jgi:hypothetical protein
MYGEGSDIKLIVIGVTIYNGSKSYESSNYSRFYSSTKVVRINQYRLIFYFSVVL